MKTKYLLTASILVISAQASTINLDSSAVNTSNNSGQATIDIQPHPAWAAAMPNSFWVSSAITGNPSQAGYTILPDGMTITFSQQFVLDAPATSSSLSVMADDTTSVVVNGTTIFAAMNNPVGGYPTCSSQPIGCLTSTREDFTSAQIDPFLKVGMNTISFGVVQKNAVSFGLDYAGAVSTAPEPASFALIGTGLVALALAGRRRLGKLKGSVRTANQS